MEYPIGHARRRADGIPKLIEKFKINPARQFPTRQQQRILDVSSTEPAPSRCRLTNTSIYMSSEPASSKA